MISQTMQDAINQQIAKEMYSANLYLAMAGYFYSQNLVGFANWMRVQVQEETFHASKFYDYIVTRGGVPKVSKIEEPPSIWDSPVSVFEASLRHEEMITGSINKLADLAISLSDHATNSMLQWFITEQVEEEATVYGILEKMKMIGDFKGGLLMLDAELMQRTFVSPASAKV